MDKEQPNDAAAQQGTVRVRMTADGEVGDGDQKRKVVAGTTIKVSADEAKRMIDAGEAVAADYGQGDAEQQARGARSGPTSGENQS